MTESKICTCPSGDGSLRWPCPAHPAVEQAGGDERKLSDLGNELHNLSCSIVHENEEWAEQIGGIARELWNWPQARAALAQPSPVRSSLLINGYQLRAALDFIAPDGTAEQLESEACIECRQQDADFLEAGLYAFCAEYPEEGGVLLDEEPTTAQPSPLQSEQAEAERPEVVAYFDRNYPSTGDAFIWSNYEGSPYEPVMTVDQHNRILDTRWNRAMDLMGEHVSRISEKFKAERDAALARVAELEANLAELEKQEPVARIAFYEGSNTPVLVGWAHMAVGQHSLYATPAAQAQHSVPEELSFEYRHPNGESHTVTVSRDQVINEMPDFLFEALCSKFCNCEPVGETNVVECSCDEYAEEFKLLAAAPGKEAPQAWIDVQAERRRQVEAEGWTPEHDDEHSHGQMARASACYALAGSSAPSDGTAALLVSLAWPWDEQWWKPSTARRDMVKACALGLAEIERLDRAAANQGGPRDA